MRMSVENNKGLERKRIKNIGIRIRNERMEMENNMTKQFILLDERINKQLKLPDERMRKQVIIPYESIRKQLTIPAGHFRLKGGENS